MFCRVRVRVCRLTVPPPGNEGGQIYCVEIKVTSGAVATSRLAQNCLQANVPKKEAEHTFFRQIQQISSNGLLNVCFVCKKNKISGTCFYTALVLGNSVLDRHTKTLPANQQQGTYSSQSGPEEEHKEDGVSLLVSLAMCIQEFAAAELLKQGRDWQLGLNITFFLKNS